MIWFEYKYTTSSDILNNLKLLTEYSIVEYSVLIVLLILMVTMIYYILPIYNIRKDTLNIKKEKERKKELLRLIVIQAKINEDIEKELDIH